MTWKKLKSDKVFESKYFHLSVDECETSSGLRVPRYYVVDFPDWVQCVAVDEAGSLILVNQYRYPGKGLFLEFPGGSTDANRGEEPQVAAERELLEETGHSSSEWIYLGSHYPNPALQTNRCHSYLALNCKKTAELNLDPFEELTVTKMSVEDYTKHCRTQPQNHSLMLATIFLALPYLK
ncbi:MAG: NUDIX hydrolase [Bdellovibrionota bacterium]